MRAVTVTLVQPEIPYYHLLRSGDTKHVHFFFTLAALVSHISPRVRSKHAGLGKRLKAKKKPQEKASATLTEGVPASRGQMSPLAFGPSLWAGLSPPLENFRRAYLEYYCCITSWGIPPRFTYVRYFTLGATSCRVACGS